MKRPRAFYWLPSSQPQTHRRRYQAATSMPKALLKELEGQRREALSTAIRENQTQLHCSVVPLIDDVEGNKMRHERAASCLLLVELEHGRR